ncbi:MAG TPA: filamentous hemagglutinin N-terminal domain-containing protein [Rhizomicrobium sp.]|jgi:filamentous hemagglutinin family protein|nr:filamentous hemagglutinin N-terminal domain-containing protein [Rhizomicrobium sp.]
MNLTVLNNGASLLALTALFAGVGMPAVQAGTLPGHGRFASGHGSITKSGQLLTIDQSSSTGIIDWATFSIGKNNSVNFNNADGATLNRVTGGAISRIYGRLHGAGSIYLINNAGVVILSTGRIVTGGSFAASSDNDVASSFGVHKRLLFTGGASGNVVNGGHIVSANGRADLDGHNVNDSGTISAQSVSISATGNENVAGGITAKPLNGHGGKIATSAENITFGGARISGTSWLVNSKNLRVTPTAARAIDFSLNEDTNVTLETVATDAKGQDQTTNADDIIISAPLAWASSAQLKLSAYHSIQFDAPMSLSGPGGVNLATNPKGGGSIAFITNAVSFNDSAGGVTLGSLMIDGAGFRLVNSLSQLSKWANANPAGHYALAKNINATKDGVYRSSLVGADFSGQLEGLGHKILNLTIKESTSDTTGDLGLFSEVDPGAAINDLTLRNFVVNATNAAFVGGIAAESVGATFDHDVVIGTVHAARTGNTVGLLVGYNVSSIANSHAQGEISGPSAYAGGLAGENDDKITRSSADVTIDAEKTWTTETAGGLVGYEAGDIDQSFATGDVNGAATAGGLVGNFGGTIESSYATGNVTGGLYAGGLLGAGNGTVSDSFATGNVTSNDAAYAGGLAGRLNGGKVVRAYATGTVTSTSNGGAIGGFVGFADDGVTISQSYSAGNVTAGKNSSIGGFVGSLAGDTGSARKVSQIMNSYETGSVHEDGASGSSSIGGFAGENNAIIKSSYAIGNVSYTGSGNPLVGGFVGRNVQGFQGLTYCYWDKDTSGQGAGPYGTGVRTAQLAGSLLPGLQSSIWGVNPNINGGFPYLKILASSY